MFFTAFQSNSFAKTICRSARSVSPGGLGMGMGFGASLRFFVDRELVFADVD